MLVNCVTLGHGRSFLLGGAFLVDQMICIGYSPGAPNLVLGQYSKIERVAGYYREGAFAQEFLRLFHAFPRRKIARVAKDIHLLLRTIERIDIVQTKTAVFIRLFRHANNRDSVPTQAIPAALIAHRILSGKSIPYV